MNKVVEKSNMGLKKLQRGNWSTFLLALIGFVSFIIVWFVLSRLMGEFRLPDPITVIRELFVTATESQIIAYQGAGNGGFLPHILVTTQRYALGTISGIALALVMLALCFRFVRLLKFLTPITDILKAIPPLATVPFLILWFGPTLISIMFVTIFYTYITVFIAGIEAFRRIDPVCMNFAQTLGASKNTIAFRVVFPQLFPALAGPIRVSAIASWGLVVVGEQLGIASGIGRIINAFASVYMISLIMVAIVWVLIMALVSEAIISLIIGYFTRWVPKVPSV